MGDKEQRAQSGEQGDKITGSFSKLLAPSSELIRMRKPELLAPAGSPEKLEYAFAYGADAVYLSGKNYGLRQAAGNFTLQEMAQAVEIAHRLGKKVYVAVNAYLRNEDLAAVASFLKGLGATEIDAVIVADPGVLFLCALHAPDLAIHLSTQANTLNSEAVRFWRKAGVARVGLARELTLKEIGEIASQADVEVFVHGAMCIAYSGRCLVSRYLANRDPNRGDCAQACRWKYYLMEEKRPGDFFPVQQHGKGTFFFNSKDLCLIEYLPALMSAGVRSFKIEGRTKSLHYLSVVTKVYRQAIDACTEDPDRYKSFLPEWRRELEKVSHRPYCTGFLVGDGNLEDTDTSSPSSTYKFVGTVGNQEINDMYSIKVKNKLSLGQEVEILQPKGYSRTICIEKIIDSDTDLEVKEAHVNSEVLVPLGEKIEKYSILRRKIKD